MSILARKLCARYHADPPTVTLAQLETYLSQGRITQAEFDCITDPACDCDWTTLAAVPAEEA